MGWLLLGYDVENQDPEATATRDFLKTAARVHSELDAPGMLFLCGRTLEHNTDSVLEAVECGLFEVGSHGYSHIRFKTLWQVDHNGREEVHEGGSLGEIVREVDRSCALIRNRLGIEPRGLTTPWGYYRGLGDRPDLLALLRSSGIRWIRSWMRNASDWVPVELSRQPFFYAAQGFPELLEIPLTGRHDCDWATNLGFEPREFGTVEAYADYVAGQLDTVAANDWVFCNNQHDTTTIRWDPQMIVVRRLVERARELGMRVGRFADYYASRVGCG